MSVIRGGGAQADLHWLNEYLLAKLVCRFPAPVFTGIGHERDTTILDEYAHRQFGRPSKVIGYIKETIVTRATQALGHWTQLVRTVEKRLANAQLRTIKHFEDTVLSSQHFIAKLDMTLDAHSATIRQAGLPQGQWTSSGLTLRRTRTPLG
jgi:exodeoxyribonuclease VII large subunit